jgi:3-hydroxyacyl-CoA dehydrogenase
MTPRGTASSPSASDDEKAGPAGQTAPPAEQTSAPAEQAVGGRLGVAGTHVAVAGAGSIGVAWAIVFARSGAEVLCYDPETARRQAVDGELGARLTLLDQAGLLDEPPAVIAARVQVTAELAECVSGAVYVQECAPEDLELKRELFARLDAATQPSAVLASSSSALMPSQLFAGLDGARRCLVAHPGNPPYLLPVVELVPSPETAPEVLTAAESLLRRCGLSPVRLEHEIEGFIFNRLQGAVLREAYCLVRDGVAAPESIDTVMRDGLGRRWSVLGPFETAELNTRGGIDAHARRLGPAYRRMGQQRGQDDPWPEEVVEQVSRAVQRRLPRDRWEDGVAWRDALLSALEALRRSDPRFGRPPGLDAGASPDGAGGSLDTPSAAGR